MWRDRGEVGGGGVARDTNEDIGAARGAERTSGPHVAQMRTPGLHVVRR
jgi:hypothetical protein